MTDELRTIQIGMIAVADNLYFEAVGVGLCCCCWWDGVAVTGDGRSRELAGDSTLGSSSCCSTSCFSESWTVEDIVEGWSYWFCKPTFQEIKKKHDLQCSGKESR